MNNIVSLFNTDLSLKDLQKKFNIDERKIRKIWKENFSDIQLQERKNRIISHYNKQRISNELVDKIYSLTLKGNSVPKIAKELNLSKGVVAKYINKDKDIRNISLQNGKTKGKSFSRLDEERANKAKELFYTDLSVSEISKICGLSISSIYNIFRKMNGYNERKNKQILLAQKKTMKTLIKAGTLGSKPENIFYNIINQRLNTKVIHHDLDLMPPFEIDITIPEYKIAICWDGIGHFQPIFGEKIFKQVVYRDRQKRKYFKKIGWKCFSIKDLQNHYKMDFIEEQFDRLLNEFQELKWITNKEQNIED